MVEKLSAASEAFQPPKGGSPKQLRFPMPAKTTNERKAAERERKRVAGLEEVRGIWADKALHPAIKDAARKLSGKEKTRPIRED